MAPQLTFSADSQPAVGFGVTDSDTGASQGLVALPRYRSPHAVPGAQLVLDLAYSRNTLELLTGGSPGLLACCSTAAIVGADSQLGFGSARTVFSGLTGFTQGRLVSIGGRLLAAVATARGVWVAQSTAGARFGSAHQLSGPTAQPTTLRAVPLPQGGGAVAWTAAHGSLPPQSVEVARGTQTRAPGRPQKLLGVAAGHAIDELSIAPGATSPGGSAPIVAWVESWLDRHGSYQSRVGAVQLDSSRRVSSFAVAGQIVSGVSVAQDPAGRALLGFEACTREGECSVRAAVRSSTSARFGPARRLGAIDAAGVPVAAISSAGAGLVGWIANGHVLASALSAGAMSLAAPFVVSHTRFASDLTLAFAPGGSAFAVWSQGTLAPDLLGAFYRG